MEQPRLPHMERPLVTIDTETTGPYVMRDRIVEIAMVKLHPDGRRERWVRRVNPEMRIPVEATAIHGITNADVEFCPTFRKIAEEMIEWMGEADLGGFNIHSFDIKILQAELRRCGRSLPMENRRVIDVQVIFHRREPRDLTAAVRFYLDRDHKGAHGAEADAEATLDVLLAQIERYADLDPGMDALASYSRRSSERYVDPDRKLEWRDGEACFTFGKHAGRTLRSVAESDPDYFSWILASDFPDPLKELIRAAKEQRFPKAEPAEEA